MSSKKQKGKKFRQSLVLSDFQLPEERIIAIQENGKINRLTLWLLFFLGLFGGTLSLTWVGSNTLELQFSGLNIVGAAGAVLFAISIFAIWKFSSASIILAKAGEERQNAGDDEN